MNGTILNDNGEFENFLKDKIKEKANSNSNVSITDMEKLIKAERIRKIKDFFYAIIRPIKNKIYRKRNENNISSEDLQNMLDNLQLGK